MTFVKGHPGGLRKGKKNKSTILKEERRAIFDAEVSKMFIEKIQEARPEYLLDQYLGKAPDILNVDAKVERSGEDVVAIATEAAKLLKQKKV